MEKSPLRTELLSRQLLLRVLEQLEEKTNVLKCERKTQTKIEELCWKQSFMRASCQLLEVYKSKRENQFF